MRVRPIPEGLVPKRIGWQALPKAKMKDTLFVDFDLSKDDGDDAIDFSLLQEMFCRSQADCEAEEAQKKAAKERQEAASAMCRTVLEVKQINDAAMAIASLRIPSADIVEALSTCDDFALNAE